MTCATQERFDEPEHEDGHGPCVRMFLRLQRERAERKAAAAAALDEPEAAEFDEREWRE